MVSVSHESPEETEARLRRVLGQTRLEVLPCLYAFVESSTSDRLDVREDALAIVRDESVWSQLVPAPPGAAEPFDVWSFHFPPDVDNSGFVGWMSTHIKRRFGSGVIVICGYNSRDGVVFDYYGCPSGLGPEVIAFICELGTAREAVRDTAVP